MGRQRGHWFLPGETGRGHDHLARTAVVYDWGSRTARMSTPLAAWLDGKSPDAPE